MTRAPKRTGQKRAKRKRAPYNGPRDPRAEVSPRVFELIMNSVEGDPACCIRQRIRFEKGDFAENLYELGANQYLVGSLSEMIGHNKWSPFGWGMVCPADVTSVREIIELPKAIAHG